MDKTGSRTSRIQVDNSPWDKGGKALNQNERILQLGKVLQSAKENIEN